MAPPPPTPPRPPTIPQRPLEADPIEITNVKDGEVVHQRFLIVHGRAGPRNGVSFDRLITVACHDFPTTQWPCVDSHFKALVHLVPGPNTVSFIFESTTSVLPLRIQYLPLLQNPPLFLCIFVASDSPGTFDVPPEKSHENTLAIATEKLRMAGYLWQAFCGEQMYRHGFGRRTFRLDESWLPDTVMGGGTNALVRQTATVHIIRSRYSLKEIRDPSRAQQSPHRRDDVQDLWSIFLEDLQTHPRFASQDNYIVAGLVLDAHWDVKSQVILGHAALGGGSGDRRLGIFGSHLTHAWPRNIHEVVPCMMNATKTDTRYVADDANESGEWWRAHNIGIGSMMHEVGHAFNLSHSVSGIMSRGANNWNRTFVVKEPGNRGPLLAKDEAGSHWHRVDAVTLRYHPAFRIPSDGPSTKGGEGGISIYPAIESYLQLVASSSGIILIELLVNGDYRAHREYVSDPSPPKHLLLSVQDLKETCRCEPGQSLGIKVTLTNLESEQVDDVDQFLRDHIVQLPGIPGLVIKSAGYGHRQFNGQESTVSFTKPIQQIRIHHGSFMDGLVFQFVDGTQVQIGSNGGGHSVFTMQPREYITGLIVRSGAWVDGLQIKTSFGRVSPWYGGHGGGLHIVEPPEGYRVVGMYACAAQWMDSCGIFFQPL